MNPETGDPIPDNQNLAGETPGAPALCSRSLGAFVNTCAMLRIVRAKYAGEGRRSSVNLNAIDMGLLFSWVTAARTISKSKFMGLIMDLRRRQLLVFDVSNSVYTFLEVNCGVESPQAGI